MNVNPRDMIEAVRSKRDEAAYQAAIAAGKVDAVDQWLSSVGYRDMGKIDRVVLCKTILLFINRYDRSGLYLHGNAGTGKTKLAKLLAARFPRSHEVRHKWRICGDIVDAYDPEMPGLTTQMGHAFGKRLEVYDELGNEPKAKFGVELMPTIIQNRFTHWERGGYRTIWISNHHPATPPMERYGSHVLDRLRGMSLMLEFTGESLR